MGRYLTILFSDLERHSREWARVPRERMVGIIAEYRYLAESLAGQYGCLYREWAGDGHMILFERADTATQFGLRLIESWTIGRKELPALRDSAPMSLRVGCHFGECTPLGEGEGWIGRANAVAKRVEGEAPPDALYATESVLDLLDLPLYEYEEAGLFALKGDFVSERRLYRIASFDQDALEAKPDDELSAEEWFLRGAALIATEQENSDEEARCYEEALRLRPDYPEAHVNLAIVLRAQGRQGEAAAHYQEALRLRADYPEAHYNYGAMLEARGSPAGALEHYREALRLRPDYVEARHALANLLVGRAEPEPAADEYRETLRLRPNYPEAHSNYAILLESQGDVDGAAEHYREALRLRPDNPQGHYNYALFLEATGALPEAERHYRRAIELWPDYAEAHNNLAILLQLGGDLDAAEAHYRKALRLRPEDPEAHYNFGLLLRAQGDEEAARSHFRTAFELAPEVPVFRSALEGK